MALTIPVHLAYAFDVKAKADDVFAVLAHVPTSASFFPKVARLTDLGENSYRWEMESVGTPQFNLATVYAARYRADRANGTITWTPIVGEGNAKVEGNWTIDQNRKSTHIELNFSAQLQLPLPGMMKMLVTQIVVRENEKLIEQYIDQLIVRFGGEA